MGEIVTPREALETKSVDMIRDLIKEYEGIDDITPIDVLECVSVAMGCIMAHGGVPSATVAGDVVGGCAEHGFKMYQLVDSGLHK